ncbi:MAG TPA: heme lyase CcmF/NrfE family subunit [Candidatus Binatia bacterium]|jgi:cytochrome c-type biogenesis protein CcmF|nr:heme lyase CcmF/NrfE family subunit [Candidatus Binatia bacterium]
MTHLGTLALYLAFVLALYAIATSLWGAFQRRSVWVASGTHAAYAVFGCVAVAVAALLHALVTRDFNVEYVAAYSSSTLPMRYTIAALWGGQKGSLLFWAFILTFFSTLVHVQNRAKNRELMPYVTATLMTLALFFLGLLCFITPPFERLAFTPREGSDLNPLLQNYWMTIHPPSLYLGYVSASVPFAFAMAALATGKLGDVWIRTTRRWALLSWFFLSVGNMLGGRWAYEVLGWGGYWAWDPVENAAIMPWFTASAYLHSVMIQEKKNMLKVWNMVLVILTFALTIFGTFLTRSGVISSVHSFTQSGLGPYFMAFLILVIGVSLGLLCYRLPELKSENELDSLLSREAAFLLNNWVLVGLAFATFWGTVFPVLSEWVRGVKITVGPPFFNKVNGPLGVLLLFLTGVGPVIAWRRASAKSLRRNFSVPVLSGFGAGVLFFALGYHHYYAVVVFSLAGFVLGTIVSEFYRGTRARQAILHEGSAQALSHLVGKNPRRYGGYIVHIGVVLIFIGVAGSSFFKIEKQMSLKPGDSLDAGRYTLKYTGMKNSEDAHIASQAAEVEVFIGGQYLTTMHPEKRLYKRQNQPTTEVAIRPTLRDDLYVVLGSYDEPSGLATLQVFVNPLLSWLWIGGLTLVLGTCIIMAPNPAERRALALAGMPAQIGEEIVAD